MHDLLITGGPVVAPEWTRPLDVAVDGETIVALEPHVERTMLAEVLSGDFASAARATA